ncbi:MAG: hypothetical protein ACI9IV_002089 [Paracoccaceae bacterium]|jgi:hypothetical protein
MQAGNMRRIYAIGQAITFLPAATTVPQSTVMHCWLVWCRAGACGGKLTVRYSGVEHNIPRHSCCLGQMDNNEPKCTALGRLRVDDLIEEALLQVVTPGAILAAQQPESEAVERRDQVREALSRDMEAARYVTDRAFRHYGATDPANPLVAGELEARWKGVSETLCTRLSPRGFEGSSVEPFRV